MNLPDIRRTRPIPHPLLAVVAARVKTVGLTVVAARVSVVGLAGEQQHLPMPNVCFKRRLLIG
jgi:hypothetical protein